MNNTFSQIASPSRINWKKLMTAAALCAFALAPALVGSTPAMADGDDSRGGYRYNRDDNNRNSDNRNKDHRDKDNHDKDNRHKDYRNNDNRHYDYRNNDNRDKDNRDKDNRDKDNRNNDNRHYDYRNNDNRNNDRYGNNGNPFGFGYGGGVFGNAGERRTKNGVVTNVRGDNRATVRIDGRDYDVQTSWKLNDRIRRGSRVQVSGFMRGNDITGAVIILDQNSNDRYDNDRYDYNRYDTRFEFNGRVTDLDERDRNLRVRADNGREYSLRVDDRKDLKGVRRGDRVRLRGQTRNGVSIVDDVDKI